MGLECLLTYEQPTTQCDICHERSTWEFLRDFYSRVEAAHEYARRLENDLEHARYALLQSEASLVSSWEKLEDERLEFRAAQEELVFERERHKETTDMLERVFHEAIRSSQIADALNGQIATLRAANGVGASRPLLDTPVTMASSPTPQGTSVLSNPRQAEDKKQPERSSNGPTGQTALVTEEMPPITTTPSSHSKIFPTTHQPLSKGTRTKAQAS